MRKMGLSKINSSKALFSCCGSFPQNNIYPSINGLNSLNQVAMVTAESHNKLLFWAVE